MNLFFVFEDYKEVRDNIVEAEENMRTGGNIYLNPREEQADEILLYMKQKAINQGIIDNSNYAPAMHFFNARHLLLVAF